MRRCHDRIWAEPPARRVKVVSPKSAAAVPTVSPDLDGAAAQQEGVTFVRARMAYAGKDNEDHFKSHGMSMTDEGGDLMAFDPLAHAAADRTRHVYSDR